MQNTLRANKDSVGKIRTVFLKSTVRCIGMSKVSEKNSCWGTVNIILRGRNPIWYNWYFLDQAQLFFFSSWS